MLIPIRCFTCNKVIANKWQKYKKQVDGGVKEDEALDNAGLKRYCCRRMFLSHVDLIDKLLLYSENNITDSKEKEK